MNKGLVSRVVKSSSRTQPPDRSAPLDGGFYPQARLEDGAD